METTVITARYSFTEDEKNILARELAQKEVELRGEHDALDRVKQTFKERIGGLENKIALLAGKVTNGYEFRETKCRIEYDRASKMKHYRDLSTEEIVESRPFTPEDIQMQFKIQ